MHNPQPKIPKFSATAAGAMALLLAALLAGALIPAPIQIQFHIAFAIPIFLAAWTRSRRFLWSMAIFAVGLTLVKVIFGARPQSLTPIYYFYVNRGISIVTLLACAWVAHLLIGVMEWTEREHERMKTILGTIPVGVVIADLPADTIVFNAAAASMLGVISDHLYNLHEMGERFADVEDGSSDGHRHGIDRALSGETVSGMERELHFPDGRHLTILVSATPLRGRAGEVIGGISGFVDITQQKLMQAQLDQQRRQAEESSRRKSRFLATVSHDIRTPANAINLLAELLQRSSNSPSLAEEIPQIAGDLKSSALSLVQLVSDVLDLTRFDVGNVELTETEFAFGQFVQEECRQFHQQARDKGLQLTCRAPDPDVLIRADRVKLSRILANLIGNAVKFTEQGGVTVECDHQSGGIQLRVIDTGPGISPEHHEHIFDEYFQIKNPRRDHEKGSGLGLAICRKLAEAMNTRLTLSSTGSEGATFVLTIPAARVALSPAPAVA